MFGLVLGSGVHLCVRVSVSISVRVRVKIHFSVSVRVKVCVRGFCARLAFASGFVREASVCVRVCGPD